MHGAVVALGTASAPHQVTVQLSPVELGRVEIRLDRDGSGAASVQVSADRPATLDLLQRDRGQLQHTLEQAGLPTEGRLTFHLTPSPDTATAVTPTDARPNASPADTGQPSFTQMGSGHSAFHHSGHGQAGYAPAGPSVGAGTVGDTDLQAALAGPAARSITTTGIDITA